MSTKKTPGRSKYGVRNDAKGKADRTVDNICFASRREAVRYCELKMLQQIGEICCLQLQKEYELWVGTIRVCRYRADFVYKTRLGAEVVEDAKGVRTPEYRLKAKLMLAIHNIKIQEV